MTAIPLPGDRSAFDDINYPERHSAGNAAGAPTIHVPEGGAVGDIAVWNGNKWVAQQLSSAEILTPIMTIGTYEGNLNIGETPLAIYNRYGASRRITEVFLSVGTAPTGANLEVDVLVAGASIFYPGNEAAILATETTGVITSFADDIWLANSALSWEILQVGSTLPGSNLVIHILHIPYVATGSGSGGGSGS